MASVEAVGVVPSAAGSAHASVVGGSSTNPGEAGPSASDGTLTKAPSAGTPRVTHGIEPVIQNVVATTNLGVQLDLKTIALQARNAEYNPKRFAAVIMRIREPKTTALIFSSGKIVVTGAKSEAESTKASRKYAKIVYKLGYKKAKFTEFTVQNIVASCDVSFPVRLEGKVVLTGAKVRQEIYDAFNNIYAVLQLFRKK